VTGTATIAGIGTALPPSAVQDELWEGYFAGHYQGGRRGLARRIFANSGVQTRQAAVSPLLEDVSDWSTERRMRRYQLEAVPLARRFVRVFGEQFAWTFEYREGGRPFRSAQLYLPANKPIIIRLRSKDVIHSFGVPEFRVKQDAIPGLTIPIWFVPDVTTAEMRSRTGKPEFQYEIACAQLCGLGHYRMRGFVTVQTPEEFQKWLEERIAEQSAPDPFK